MVLRVLQALAGTALAAGGGYFAWLNRGSVDGMFPPEPGLSVWTFVGGLVVAIVGAVTIVHAIGPRPKEKARKAEQEEKRARILKQADQFYTAQAEGLGDFGAREGEPLFPEGLRPGGTPRQPITPTPGPEAVQPPEPFRLHSLSQPPRPVARPPVEAVDEPLAPAAEAAPVEAAAEPEPEPAVAPRPAPAASLEPDQPLAARPFPAPISAQTIPRATDTPPAAPAAPARAAPSARDPAAASSTPQAGTPAANGAGGDPALEDIRTAIAQNRLEEADKLLATTRKRLSNDEGSHAIELAQLTGLAGDHAAADGRLGSAKWLWRLALQRFAAAGAIDNPAAREVSERMRLADQ